MSKRGVLFHSKGVDKSNSVRFGVVGITTKSVSARAVKSRYRQILYWVKNNFDRQNFGGTNSPSLELAKNCWSVGARG